jgi:N-acetylneuraminate synthase
MWPGPDVAISIDPRELRELVEGSRAIFEALGGDKAVLPEEQPTIDFAYASVVSTAQIRAGETFSAKNLWVKRPGKGGIPAVYYERIVGKKAASDIPPNEMLRWDAVEGGQPRE